MDSFDEFIQMSVQRIVEDTPSIELQAEAQHRRGEIETPVIIINVSSNYMFSKKLHHLCDFSHDML